MKTQKRVAIWGPWAHITLVDNIQENANLLSVLYKRGRITTNREDSSLGSLSSPQPTVLFERLLDLDRM